MKKEEQTVKKAAELKKNVGALIKNQMSGRKEEAKKKEEAKTIR